MVMGLAKREGVRVWERKKHSLGWRIFDISKREWTQIDRCSARYSKSGGWGIHGINIHVTAN